MTRLVVELPDVVGLTQDEEWCTVQIGDEAPRTIRFHEYGAIFSVPGLYEELFYRRLRCSSPSTLARLLDGALREADMPPARLRGLDVGAGNGMVGEQLRQLGVSALLGADILPEAAEAARRDRPAVYEDYVVADLTALSAADVARITAFRPNLLSTVAALGFGDMPSLAFARAWNLVESPAWVVFNIKQEFLDAKYQHGFAFLHRRLRDEGLLDIRAEHTYVHRLALDGRPLHYVGIVGRKTGPIPDAWLSTLRDTPPE
jgi:predicted TPR repeat methyltransferase